MLGMLVPSENPYVPLFNLNTSAAQVSMPPYHKELDTLKEAGGTVIIEDLLLLSKMI